LKNIIGNFLREESGLTTVEYAVAGALITVAVIGAFTALGGSVAGTITILDAALPG
jgi:pilus assembly protein Flp/PilA